MTLAIQKESADDKIAVKSILKTAIFLSLTVITFISIICIVFPEKVMSLIVSDKQTLDITKTLIIYLIATQIINISISPQYTF
ncbi:hypothetical protein RBU49_01300 [Clostridium sp. MB40-C1]|uniref:hypothetical protein n=1 Tax=Clostridium sp. MB40-C1 TaxID=3070996 RepID=UPI0027DFA06D|nr:hypothetical protein [Clostridium sp. MB40-C1]WMJ80913.1 hypothetical protein RBU49_01300 [Clostridium sp. MB40-C1]